MTKRLLILLVVFGALTAAGQERGAVLMVEGGYASVHDSYLTPITYDGFDLGLGLEVMRPLRDGKWLWQLNVGADYNYVENPAQNNDLHKLMGDISFDMQRCWRGVFHPKLNFAAGPMAQVRAGIVYDEVNSNNPVTVRALAAVGATGMAWFNTRLGRMPLTLRYQAQLPALGLLRDLPGQPPQPRPSGLVGQPPRHDPLPGRRPAAGQDHVARRLPHPPRALDRQPPPRPRLLPRPAPRHQSLTC